MKMKRITGLFGFWKFPFINKFIGPKYSIRDHKVISGKPDYVGNYKIRVDGNSVPWRIKFIYDLEIRAEDRQNGVVIAAFQATVKKDGVLREDQYNIDYIKRNNLIRIYEQIEPR